MRSLPPLGTGAAELSARAGRRVGASAGAGVIFLAWEHRRRQRRYIECLADVDREASDGDVCAVVDCERRVGCA